MLIYSGKSAKKCIIYLQGIDVTVFDPWVDVAAVKRRYGISVVSSAPESLEGRFDAVILAVAHKQFEGIDARKFLRIPNGVIYDVKGVLPREQVDARL